MKHHKITGKLVAMLTALSVLTGGIKPIQNIVVAEEEFISPRLTVDLNKNDGRTPSYSKNAENWIIGGENSASTEISGLTFTLSTETEGGVVTAYNYKKLQKMSGIYPRLTMDGVTVAETENGVLKLEINGLSTGTHSLKTWHASCQSGNSASTLRISVNGQTTAENVPCPITPTDEDDAGIAYSVFEVAEGESVTVLIEAENDGYAWLNGFEIDGGDPFEGISRITPKHQDYHHDTEEGLSWTVGADAVSHDVYFGTDEAAVYNANHNAPEFKGNQKRTTYALSSDLSAIPTYYWRVDTIDSEGNVHKGAVNSFRLNRLAFPTAEGYGRFAAGGRGGQIIHVTSLKDDVNTEGTLRWAIENEIWAGVPRIIVFDVGGVIKLEKNLWIKDDGGVYVAGQTAPGDGITLINYGFGASNAQDVIIRDVRVRVGDASCKNIGGMSLSRCDHSIIDHCSMSWATDEGFTSISAANITFQWNIIAETAHYATYYQEPDYIIPHCFGASVGGYNGSYHHNLLVHCSGRCWSLAGGIEQDGVTYGSQVDIRNNVVYNWYDRTTDGGARRVNFVNNYYKAGPASITDMHLVSVDGNELDTNDMQMLYASGNMMVDRDGTVLYAANADEWESGKAVCGEKNAIEADIRSDEPFFESFVKTETAEESYESVLSYAGAGGTTERDYIDSRYIDEVINNGYTYICKKCQYPGLACAYHEPIADYPTEETFLHSTDGMTNVENDIDRDGMPNVWEEAHGLNPDDPTDGAIVSLSAEDYTNVEMYLNELIGDPVKYRTDIQGDVNADDVFDTADASAMQAWLLRTDRLPNPAMGDMNGDCVLDVFDLCMMKRLLIESHQSVVESQICITGDDTLPDHIKSKLANVLSKKNPKLDYNDLTFENTGWNYINDSSFNLCGKYYFFDVYYKDVHLDKDRYDIIVMDYYDGTFEVEGHEFLQNLSLDKASEMKLTPVITENDAIEKAKEYCTDLTVPEELTANSGEVVITSMTNPKAEFVIYSLEEGISAYKVKAENTELTFTCPDEASSTLSIGVTVYVNPETGSIIDCSFTKGWIMY